MKYKFIHLFFLLLFILINSGFIHAQEKYAVSVYFTPVLNNPDFSSVFGGESGSTVKLDKRGLIGEMEFIAYPNTVFKIEEKYHAEGYDVLKVTTSDYPYNSTELFIDSRFVIIADTLPDEREKIVPDKEIIIGNLKMLEGYPYMWGGNYAEGIEKLLDYYRPAGEIDAVTERLWCLKGVDCSGLLYQATNGATPRNTSSLINIGEGLDIADKKIDDILQMLQPLDLIVWSGHVLIVYDNDSVIESTPDFGVHKSDLRSRLKSVMKERIPVNDWNSTNGKRFVIRRWIN